MKRFYAMALAAVMLLCCCVGCGQKKPDVSDPVTPGGDVSTSTTTTTQGDESADTTTGTGDQTTDASDGTSTEGDPTADTTGTQSTTKPSDNKTTKPSDNKTTKPSDNKTTKPSDNKTTKPSNITTSNTTTTTTTKSRVTGMFSSTTTSSGGGITLPSQNEGNKGYEFDPGDEWELFWSDEFSGNTLDTSKWSYEVGKAGIYTEKAENVTVQNGNLILTARHANPKDNQGLNFTTGAVNSAHKFSFQYGRLEFRARLPYGEGVFPALWTMGDYYLTTSDEKGWPRCGEIDVMEFIGGGSEAEKYTDPANKLSTCNLHWGVNRDAHKAIGTTNAKIMDGIWADAYHIFAIEWDEKSIKWYRDDRLIIERDINDPDMLDSFHQKHWIIINVALCDFEPDIANATTPLPQSMYVDYVRVYKKK